MELKKKELVLIYVIVGLLGILLISKVILAPFHAKLVNLSSALILQEAKLKKGFSLVERKDDIEKEYGKYASYFSLQDMSEEEAVAALLKEVEKISRESGLVILDMKPQKETKSDKFSKQFLINVKVETNMKTLVTFFYALHNSPLLFSIEKFTLVPKGEDLPDLSVSLTIAGVAFL